jgi:NTP pyrophosphatase (non-canonical NTP hydrolase)
MRKQQEQVDYWIKTIGKRYFSELTNLGQLSEEVGELSRLIIREYGEQSWKNNEKPTDIKEKIAEELSDITFVVLCLANQVGIDLEESFEKKLNIKTYRDSERHKLNQKLD